MNHHDHSMPVHLYIHTYITTPSNSAEGNQQHAFEVDPRNHRLLRLASIFTCENTSSPGSIHLARILSATSAETSAFIVGVARGDPLRDALFAKASLQYYNVMQILAIVQGLDSTGGCSWGGKKVGRPFPRCPSDLRRVL